MPNINNIKELISNNTLIDTLEQTQLSAILEDSQTLVDESFGSEEPSGGNSFYKQAFNLIDAEFETFISSIENMRSSYLPSDVYTAVAYDNNGNLIEGVTEGISDGVTPLESYQNTFLRMLGMPSWEDILAEEPDTKLSIVNSDGELKDNVVTPDNIYTTFLDARQAFSTVGCFSTVGHYDLVSNYLTASEFLKKEKHFPSDAVSQIVAFSDALNSVIIADITSSEYNTAKEKVISTMSEIIQTKDSNGNTLYDKVSPFSSIISGTENTDDISTLGDPGLWLKNIDNISKKNDKNNDSTIFFSENGVLQNNYNSFLLFMYYSYVGSDPQKALSSYDCTRVYKELVQKEAEAADPSLNNIEKNIFNYSSLLFPFVKDGRISKCINEPEKIVADPFLPVTKRMVNGKFLRSSLLESIIRIRTDVISGTTSYQDASVPYLIGEDTSKNVPQRSVSGNLLGYLESMLIIRMFEALEALAQGTKNNIDQIARVQRKTGKGLFGSCYDPKERVTTAIPAITKKHSDNRVLLNNYSLIEDSFLLLLGSKNSDEDSLNLQTDINRDSSVPNSHLMSSLINLVQVPRKFINKKVEEEEKKLYTQNSVGSKVAKDIEVSIGIRSGVGILDLLVAIITMLTIEEEYLVALLTTSQRNSMYLQVNPDTFEQDRKDRIAQIPISSAVNLFTQRMNTIYQLFVDLLRK